MEFIPAINIKSKKLKINVLVVFEENQENDFISVKSINFFKNNNSIENFLYQNDVKLISNELDIPKFSKLRKVKKIFSTYLEGEKINLYEELIELGIKFPYDKVFRSSFSRKVIKWVIKNLPYGKIASYSELGKSIDSKAYQAIGNVMRKNPFPLIIPCHRVIKKNGGVGGFMGKTEESWQKNLKKKLLEMEGIYFLKNKN